MLKEIVNHRTQKRNKALGRLQKLNTFSLEEIVTKSRVGKKIAGVQLVQQTTNYKPHFTNCNFACNFLSLMQVLDPSYKSLYRAKLQKTSCSIYLGFHRGDLDLDLVIFSHVFMSFSKL